ncbi:hypothetical protein M422DRAFT_257602 [Sphaerobolus stellatus SS14]|uniref:Uncharacterized protein n=1 Tax=Sphaerobolus stellatus (strain SS14) TaxID=990650 RepID=A0A0C9VND0_SPHS4|nr:hypothetical protein M422DRAFT_257602 [Sphaerobolus stellatus SS14]
MRKDGIEQNSWSTSCSKRCRELNKKARVHITRKNQQNPPKSTTSTHPNHVAFNFSGSLFRLFHSGGLNQISSVTLFGIVGVFQLRIALTTEKSQPMMSLRAGGRTRHQSVHCASLQQRRRVSPNQRMRCAPKGRPWAREAGGVVVGVVQGAAGFELGAVRRALECNGDDGDSAPLGEDGGSCEKFVRRQGNKRVGDSTQRRKLINIAETRPPVLLSHLSRRFLEVVLAAHKPGLTFDLHIHRKFMEVPSLGFVLRFYVPHSRPLFAW